MDQREHERGAAAVEFALVLPMLLTLVFGIIEFGRVYNIQTSITAAAREGARAMALDNNPVTAVTTAESAAAPYSVANAQVSVTTSNVPASTPLNTCPTSNTTNALVKVTVTYPVTLLTGWFGTSITLHGTGVMRCNG